MEQYSILCCLLIVHICNLKTAELKIHMAYMYLNNGIKSTSPKAYLIKKITPHLSNLEYFLIN